MRDGSLEYYQRLFDTIVELGSFNSRIEAIAQKIERRKPRYFAVEGKTGVPWAVVGVIHAMESSCNMSANLMNGEPWNRVTALVPRGKGPWPSFEDSAVEALEYDGLAGKADWSIGATGKRLERYNGGGYKRRGVHLPYLWSGCQHGVGVGKYVKDNKYDPDAVSEQVGAMVILKRLESTGACRPGASTAAPAAQAVYPVRWGPENVSEVARGLQRWLCDIGQDVGPLDGRWGRLSARAYHAATGNFLDGTPSEIVKECYL